MTNRGFPYAMELSLPEHLMRRERKRFVLQLRESQFLRGLRQIAAWDGGGIARRGASVRIGTQQEGEDG